MSQNRVLGGVSCFEVLEVLDSFLDNALEPGERARVLAHLTECQACADFGGRYAHVIQALHVQLGAAPRVDAAQAERVSQAVLARLAQRG